MCVYVCESTCMHVCKRESRMSTILERNKLFNGAIKQKQPNNMEKQYIR